MSEFTNILKSFPPQRWQVLKYFWQGKTTKQIANKLGIKEDAVRGHFYQIYRAFGMESPNRDKLRDLLNEHRKDFSMFVCRIEDQQLLMLFEQQMHTMELDEKQQLTEALKEANERGESILKILLRIARDRERNI